MHGDSTDNKTVGSGIAVHSDSTEIKKYYETHMIDYNHKH